MKKIIVIAGIIVKNNKILAARRKKGKDLAGFWEFPGGKIKENETHEQCLNRELKEEFNIITKVGPYIGKSLYDYGDKNIYLIAYQVEHVSGEFQLIDHDKLCWLELNELSDLQWAPADIPLVEQYKLTASTFSYYQENAKKYFEDTYKNDVSHLYQPFFDQLPKNAHILDLGCGSGRESKVFLSEGYTVTPIDSSPEMAKYAESFIGQKVERISFQELNYENNFDGVWASASLLHCPRVHIIDVLKKIIKSLKNNGVAYISFKWGLDESIDDLGRYYNNYTLSSLKTLLKDIADIKIIELWDETRLLRKIEQRWTNALIKKEI